MVCLLQQRHAKQGRKQLPQKVNSAGSIRLEATAVKWTFALRSSCPLTTVTMGRLKRKIDRNMELYKAIAGAATVAGGAYYMYKHGRTGAPPPAVSPTTPKTTTNTPTGTATADSLSKLKVIGPHTMVPLRSSLPSESVGSIARSIQQIGGHPMMGKGLSRRGHAKRRRRQTPRVAVRRSRVRK